MVAPSAVKATAGILAALGVGVSLFSLYSAQNEGLVVREMKRMYKDQGETKKPMQK